MKSAFYIILSAALLTACGNSESNSTETTNEVTNLPYIGFHDTEVSTVDGQQVIDTIYYTVPEFFLTAQDSSLFTNKKVDDKVHVVNFFFTSCPSICPAMIAQMKRLQENTNDIEELVFLSHTIDPERDSIPKLNAYIAQKGLDTHNWFFLYGEREYVHDLGKNGYMLNAMEDAAAEGGFLHSEHFALIDRSGHIRGLYDGTVTEQVDRLEKDIRKLIDVEYGE